MTFGLFFAASVAVWILSAATRQRIAVQCATALIAVQCLCQAAITLFDPPASLAVAFPLDAATSIFFAYLWHRRPSTWLVAMFFASYTQCLVHLGFASGYASGTSEDLFVYGLKLNLLFAILLACNSWPGVHHVAVAFRRHMLRSGYGGRRFFFEARR